MTPAANVGIFRAAIPNIFDWSRQDICCAELQAFQWGVDSNQSQLQFLTCVVSFADPAHKPYFVSPSLAKAGFSRRATERYRAHETSCNAYDGRDANQ